MKSLKLFFVGMLALLMFPFSGLSAAADSFIKKNTAGLQIHMNGIDLTDITTQLGAYVRKFEKDIWTLATKDIVFEKYMRKVSGVTDEYVIPNAEVTELLQPFQSAWTPKGTVSFNARINKVRQIKVDFVIQDIDDIYRTYLTYLATEGVDRKDWPLVKYIVSEMMVPKIREEISELSVRGNYLAPTAGTAGTSLSSTDGILTIISDEITATNLVPITTGVITQANIIDKLEQNFVDNLPSRYKAISEPVFMAEELRMMYWRAYRGDFGGNSNYTGTEKLFIDGTKKEIIGIPEMNGSQRLIHTTKRNMLCIYDKIMTPNSFKVEEARRELSVLTDFKRGYGFGNLDEVFVNDQA